MNQRKILIPGIGEVLLEKSRRAKHLSLSIRPFRGIRVAVPTGISFEAAADFARSKSQWILRHLSRMQFLEQEIFDSQKILKNSEIDRKSGREIIVKRLNYLSEKYKLPYNRVFVKKQKTRWGSCSEKKNVNLNINILRLPEELMDYVILHELTHTRELNHSSNFWSILESFIQNARELDRALQRYSLLLAE